MPRPHSILRQRAQRAFLAGFSRGEIARQENVTYAAVWRHTKDLTPPAPPKLGRKGQRLDDGSLRVEAMRSAYDEGMTVLEVAAKFQTSYQNAWQATRGYRRTHPLEE